MFQCYKKSGSLENFIKNYKDNELFKIPDNFLEITKDTKDYYMGITSKTLPMSQFKISKNIYWSKPKTHLLKKFLSEKTNMDKHQINCKVNYLNKKYQYYNKTSLIKADSNNYNNKYKKKYGKRYNNVQRNVKNYYDCLIK